MAGGKIFRFRKSRRKRIRINTSQKAQVALNLAIRNKGKLSFLQHELKFIDKIEGGQDIIDTGTFYLLNGVATGDTNIQREGRRTLLKRLHVNIKFIHNPAITSSNIRVIVFKDTMSNGTVPVTTDVLNSADIESHYAVNNLPQFKIIWDKIYNLTNVMFPVLTKKIVKKLNINVWHNDNTAGDGSIQKNAIWLMFISDVPVTQNPPGIRFFSRMRFVDN